MSSTNTLTCDRCGATSVIGDGDPTPDGWDYTSYGDNETKGADLCPGCVQSFLDWLKNEPQKTETVHHYHGLKPSEITDIVMREMGKQGSTGLPKVCTCPKTKVNDPIRVIDPTSCIGWTYKPCPLHPITVTL